MEEARRETDAVANLVESVGRSWIEIGIRCLNVRTKKLYRFVGADSFGDWSEQVRLKKSTAYECSRIIEQLKSIPIAELEKFRSKENAKELVKLAESQRTPDLILKAQVMSEMEFEAVVKSKLVGAQIEQMVRRTLYLPETLAAFYDKTLLLAKAVEETPVFEPAFEAILAEYFENHQGSCITGAVVLK